MIGAEPVMVKKTLEPKITFKKRETLLLLAKIWEKEEEQLKARRDLDQFEEECLRNSFSSCIPAISAKKVRFCREEEEVVISQKCCCCCMKSILVPQDFYGGKKRCSACWLNGESAEQSRERVESLRHRRSLLKACLKKCDFCDVSFYLSPSGGKHYLQKAGCDLSQVSFVHPIHSEEDSSQ